MTQHTYTVIVTVEVDAEAPSAAVQNIEARMNRYLEDRGGSRFQPCRIQRCVVEQANRKGGRG